MQGGEARAGASMEDTAAPGAGRENASDLLVLVARMRLDLQSVGGAGWQQSLRHRRRLWRAATA